MGSARHPHLVLQLKDTEITVPLNIPAADVEAGKYDGLGKDSSTLHGGEAKTVASLLRHITGKPVFKPNEYRASDGVSQGLKCAHKANDGVLYPLDKSFVFIHKPAMWIRFSDVDSVGFQRGGGGGSSSKTVDVVVTVKAGASDGGRDVVFQSIDSRERDGLRAFLKGKGITIHEEPDRQTAMQMALAAERDEDEDDDDFDVDAEEAKSGKKRGREDDSDGGPDSHSEDGDFDGAGGGGSDDGSDASGSSGGGKRKAKAANGGAGKPDKKRSRRDDDDD